MQFVRITLLCASIALAGCQPESRRAESPPAEKQPVAATSVEQPEPAVGEHGVEPTVLSVASDAPGAFDITYEWKIDRKPNHDWRVFVHFTDGDGQIRFQNDHDPKPATSQWQPGKLQQGPFKVKLPDGFEGEVQIRMGLYDQDKPGEGSRGRRELDGNADDELRVFVGRLLVGDANVELLPMD